MGGGGPGGGRVRVCASITIENYLHIYCTIKLK
jgi:hypothetical protein